ncbi:MAG: tetratricopeptide repeat protein [Bacteroidota bacterium]
MSKKIKINVDNSISSSKGSTTRERKDQQPQSLLSKYINSTTAIGIIILLGLIIGFFKFREARINRNEQDAQEAIWRSQKYFKNKQFDNALQGDDLTPGFLAIAKKWPSTKAGQLAYYYIALIYIDRKMYQEAVQYLNKIRFPNPVIQSFSVWGIKGDAYSEMGNYQEALVWYQKAANTSPNSQITPVYLKKIAAIWEDLGELEKAKNCYQLISQEFPDSPDYEDTQKHLGFLTTTVERQPS